MEEQLPKEPEAERSPEVAGQACFFCGGSAHPATGCQYSPTCLACARCTREFWRWVKGFTNAKGRRRGPKTAMNFYEAAGYMRGTKE